MRLIVKLAGLAILVTIVGGGALLAYARGTGLRSQATPGLLETRVARAIRSVAIPTADKTRINPLANSREASNEGLQHFARYCSLCHGNTGGGEKTPLGNGLFPKPPDLRNPLTQQLTDGEIFYIIENGIRFTGMPAFGSGKPDPAGDKLAWQLVRFIRHMPRMTADEIDSMKAMNPL